MSSTLYRKYRPQCWSDLAGQDHVKDTLAQQVATEQTAHAYLLAGPRGVGKTTTARIFAKAVNCVDRKKGSGEPCNKCESCLAVTEGGSLDIIEIDAASHTGVDSVRENIVENARFSPARLKNKVFIIDEVHMLSTSAFNALLKTLEEPPPNVVFLLATTELHKIPATVVSRCQRFDLRKIPVAAVIERLKGIAASEKIKVEDGVLADIARLSEGCLRDAEGLLGKLLAVAEGGKVTEDDVLMVLPRSDWESAAKFVDALVAGETAAALMTVGECLDSGADVEQFADEVTELLRKAMLVKLAGSTAVFKSELDESRLERVAGWAKSADLKFLVRALEIMLEKRRELKGSHPVQLPLELAAVLICNQSVAAELVSRGSEATLRDASAPSEKRTAPAKKDTAAEIVPAQKDVAAGLAPARAEVKNNDDHPTPSATPNQPEPTPEPEKEKTNVAAAVVEDVGEAVNEAAASPVIPVKAACPQEPQGVGDEGIQKSQPEESEPNEEPVTTIEEVKKVWKDFMTKASEASHSLSLLLGAVTPVEVVGQKVRIGSGFPFYKDKLNDDKTRMVLENALSGVLGRKILIEGVTIEKTESIVHNDVAVTEMSSPEPAPATAEPADGATKIAATFGGEIVS